MVSGNARCHTGRQADAAYDQAIDNTSNANTIYEMSVGSVVGKVSVIDR